MPAAVTQALWFTVYAPAGTPAASTPGTFTVRPANAPALEILVETTVYNFELPTQGHLKTAFALMDGYLEKLYGKPLAAPLRRKYGDYVLKFRLNPDDISRTDPPDLDDLAYYDARGLNAFNVINMVQPRGDRTWVCYSELGVYVPSFKQSLIERLDPYVAELKRRGLLPKAYCYTFDERGEDYYPTITEYFGAHEGPLGYSDADYLTGQTGPGGDAGPECGTGTARCPRSTGLPRRSAAVRRACGCGRTSAAARASRMRTSSPTMHCWRRG